MSVPLGRREGEGSLSSWQGAGSWCCLRFQHSPIAVGEVEMGEERVLRGQTRCDAAGEGGRNGHRRAAGGPTGIPGREAGAGFAALLLFHHSSAANGRD